jgi:hypothetical protein
MFKMAEPLACQQKRIFSLLLLLITLCVIFHFLVEDISFQRAVDRSSQNRSIAGLTFDEQEHQDDLVMVASLPESIQRNDSPAIPAWGIASARQSAVSIRIPPKIA